MPAAFQQKARRGQQGFVLVIVLWVLAILTVVSVGFGRRAVLDRRAAAYTMDKTQATFMARGAAERGIVELRNKAVVDAYYDQGAHTGLDQQWNKPVNLFEEAGYFQQESPDEFDADVCRYVIVDESSKVNINMAPVEILEELDGLTRTHIRRISIRRGQERGDEPPQRFHAIEEIRYLDGIDDKDWYGTSRQAGLRDLLTCYSDGTININTASRGVLECIPDLSNSVLNTIVYYRQGEDGELGTGDDRSFKNFSHLMEQTNLSGDDMEVLTKYCTTDSRFFTVKGYATRRQGKVQAVCEAVVEIMDDTATIIQWRESAYGL